MTALLLLLLQLAAILLLAPGLAGVFGRASARWDGAEGPSLLQPWRDLLRLSRKTTLRPAGASPVFALAPAVSLATAGTAALLVPGFASGSLLSPLSDLLLVLALLAVSRTVPALASYDAGSAMLVHDARLVTDSGLGAAPVLLLVALVAALLSGGTNLEAAALVIRDGAPTARLAAGLAAAALLLGFAATPPDPADPWTGRSRAALQAAAQLRGLAALSLAAILCPFGFATSPEAWPVGIACWVLKLLVLGLLATAIGPNRFLLPAGALLALAAVTLAGFGSGA